jgi:hypothetical protein
MYYVLGAVSPAIKRHIMKQNYTRSTQSSGALRKTGGKWLLSPPTKHVLSSQRKVIGVASSSLINFLPTL